MSTEQSLTVDQTKLAMEDLNDKTILNSYPKIERRLADPVVYGQHVGLLSFVPAKGATPNERGIYGYAKLRGNFEDDERADKHAEKIIREVDSYHRIFHAHVGKPFPLVDGSTYSSEVRDIDLKKDINESYSEDVKKKREQEQKDIEDIQRREQELLDDVKRVEQPTDDVYTSLRVKKAQLTWTYAETEKKMINMCTLIAKARKEIEDMEASNPELRNVYMKKYIDAQKAIGASEERIRNDTSFMKYMVEDISLPAVDKEYENLFGKSD
jgi:hypothetical protein